MVLEDIVELGALERAPIGDKAPVDRLGRAPLELDEASLHWEYLRGVLGWIVTRDEGLEQDEGVALTRGRHERGKTREAELVEARVNNLEAHLTLGKHCRGKSVLLALL